MTRAPQSKCSRCSHTCVLYRNLCRKCFKTHPLNMRAPTRPAVALLLSWIDRDNAAYIARLAARIDRNGVMQPIPTSDAFAAAGG